MNDYFYGLISGFATAVVLVVALLAHFLFRFGPQEPRPVNIVLRRHNTTTKCDPHSPPTTHETLHWLNRLLHRLVTDLNHSAHTQQVMRSRLEQLLNNTIFDGSRVFERISVEQVMVVVPCQFKTISSSSSELEVEVEWDNNASGEPVVSLVVQSAVGYKGMVVLPFTAKIDLHKVLLTARLELHSHYLKFGFHNNGTLGSAFETAFQIQIEVGHKESITDSTAITSFIHSLLCKHIKRSLIDNDLIVPYAAFMTMIPRVLSPPMSPSIPNSELFESIDNLLSVPGQLKYE